MAFFGRLGRAFIAAGSGVAPRSGLLREAAPAAAAVPAIFTMLSRGMASNSKLFIGGLSWGTDEKTLRDAFASFGEVTDVRIITDRETGRSRGFGFVSFTSEGEAQAALNEMDGRDLAGRTIRVDYAIERSAGGGGAGGSSSFNRSGGFSPRGPPFGEGGNHFGGGGQQFGGGGQQFGGGGQQGDGVASGGDDWRG